MLFFFFKQKTAYEMRISDWSSDVCSFRSALDARRILAAEPVRIFAIGRPDLALLTGHLVEKMNAPTLSTQHATGPAAMLWACAEIGRASCRERVCQYV